jgi:DNA-binding beta-propeller fold protein YncE
LTYGDLTWTGDPVNVTVDQAANVYEADYQGENVSKFAPGGGAIPSIMCFPVDEHNLPGHVEGVAVDSHGDVFVSFNVQGVRGGLGEIEEYLGGLQGTGPSCNESIINAPTFNFVGGIAFDSKDNLIVCDQNGSVVDILEPPYYSSIAGTLGSGFKNPFHVTINRANTQVYVTDPGNDNVQVLSYPDGTNIATLGKSNGVTFPLGAVDSQNFVP